MNIQYIEPVCPAATEQQVSDLQVAAAGMSNADINKALGLTRPMERKLSTKAKVGITAGGVALTLGVLGLGVLAENKLSVAEKVVGGIGSVVSAVTGFFGSNTAAS